MFSRERTDVLLLCDDRAPYDFILDPFEVASVVSMALFDACELWSDVRPTINAVEWPSNVKRPIQLELTDFVSDVPDYWPWLAATLARRFTYNTGKR
jgi:hypothetical protein